MPLQILPWPVTGGRFQPNFSLERLTRNRTKSGQLCWFLFRFVLSVAVAIAALRGSPSWFPANSALPYPWNRKETFMSKLAWFSTRFIPTAAVLAAAMLFGAPSSAQTGASNLIPNAGSRQDPQVDNPVLEKTTPAERQAARAKRKAERAAGLGASNAIPNAGSRQDPQADNPVLVKTTPAERQAARDKRKAERAAGGPSASNPVNPKSNPAGSAEANVQTSGTPQSRN